MRPRARPPCPPGGAHRAQPDLLGSGTTVTVTGTGLTGTTAVTFGTVAAKSFKVTSATDLTAVSPAATAGAHTITLTSADGTSAAVKADVFTYTGSGAAARRM